MKRKGDEGKKCTLTIDGLSAGADPRKVAEDLRTAIAEELSKKYRNVSSTFRSLEDGAEAARLDGKTWPTATFSINVQVTAGEERGTAPVAVRRTPKTQMKLGKEEIQKIGLGAVLCFRIHLRLLYAPARPAAEDGVNRRGSTSRR